MPELDRAGLEEWCDNSTGEILGVEDVIERYGHKLPEKATDVPEVIPEWLKEIREKIPVRFIDTDRLRHTPAFWGPNDHIHMRGNAPRVEKSIRRYSAELAYRVQAILSEYGALAQELDRTFPARVVNGTSGSSCTATSLRQELDDIEKRRMEPVNVGLLPQEQEKLEFHPLSKEDIDVSKLEMLTVYAEDARKKLDVFNRLYERVEAYTRIMNSKFLHKNVQVGSGGLSVTSDDGSRLELDDLSSGEQHEMVFSYDLLFGTLDNALVLFDEPEMSLHVFWKGQFLDDLEEMAEISKFRVLLATHSPDIIEPRWDLTVELKDSESL